MGIGVGAKGKAGGKEGREGKGRGRRTYSWQGEDEVYKAETPGCEQGCARAGMSFYVES